MRALLGLGVQKTIERPVEDDSVKTTIMNEILNSTQQIREQSGICFLMY